METRLTKTFDFMSLVLSTFVLWLLHQIIVRILLSCSDDYNSIQEELFINPQKPGQVSIFFRILSRWFHWSLETPVVLKSRRQRVLEEIQAKHELVGDFLEKHKIDSTRLYPAPAASNQTHTLSLRENVFQAQIQAIKTIKASHVRERSGRVSILYSKAIALTILLLILFQDFKEIVLGFKLQASPEALKRVRDELAIVSGLAGFLIFTKQERHVQYMLWHFSMLFSCSIAISITKEVVFVLLWSFAQAASFLYDLFMALKGYKPMAKITRFLRLSAAYSFILVLGAKYILQVYLYIKLFPELREFRYLGPIFALTFVPHDLENLRYLVYQCSKYKVFPFSSLHLKPFKGGTKEMFGDLADISAKTSLKGLAQIKIRVAANDELMMGFGSLPSPVDIREYEHPAFKEKKES